MITVNQVEDIRTKLLAAENCMDEIQGILCDEPGNTPGGEAYNTCGQINASIRQMIHRLHYMKVVNTDPNNPLMRGH